MIVERCPFDAKFARLSPLRYYETWQDRLLRNEGQTIVIGSEIMKLSRQEAIKQINQDPSHRDPERSSRSLEKSGIQCDAGHCVQGYQGYGLD